MENMNLFEIQFAWFFKPAPHLDYERLALSIRKETSRNFVSPAMILPLPPMAPPEIPRLQLQTPDNQVRVTIAVNRADFFLSSANGCLEDESVESFFKDVFTTSKIFLKQLSIERLGLVGRVFLNDQSPAATISSKLLKNELPNLYEASVKIVERDIIDGLPFNDSYQFEQGINLENQQQIIVITRDINTPQEIPFIATTETIDKFVKVGRDRLRQEQIDRIFGS